MLIIDIIENRSIVKLFQYAIRHTAKLRELDMFLLILLRTVSFVSSGGIHSLCNRFFLQTILLMSDLTLLVGMYLIVSNSFLSAVEKRGVVTNRCNIE